MRLEPVQSAVRLSVGSRRLNGSDLSPKLIRIKKLSENVN
jgi:hypothetical protein